MKTSVFDQQLDCCVLSSCQKSYTFDSKEADYYGIPKEKHRTMYSFNRSIYRVNY